MRPRILELSGTAAGGVRAHVGQCAGLLATMGHEVVLAAPAGVLEALETGAARREAVEIGARPSPGDLAAVARVRRLSGRADVVHAHGLRAGAVAALALGPRRRGGTRLVVTLHNRTVGGRATLALGTVLATLIARRADAVLAVSPDLARDADRRGAREVHLAVIPAPESATGGAPAPSAPSPWPAGAARILTVARIAPQKGLELLLDVAQDLGGRAAQGLLPGVDSLRWLVAGGGPQLDAVREEARARALPVDFLGRREDVMALCASADVVVQTSVWEGQPLTIQEALRAGAAVVATDVGGTAYTARGGAVLVEPGRAALARAIEDLLTDGAAREEARARARAAAARLPGPDDLARQLRRVLLGETSAAGT